MKAIRLLLSWPIGLAAVMCGGLGLIFWGVSVVAAELCNKIAGERNDERPHIR